MPDAPDAPDRAAPSASTRWKTSSAAPPRTRPKSPREDLAPAALLLHAAGIGRLDSLDWLDAPPAAAVEHAEELLRQLGAAGPLAREIARYPLHPRLGRLIVEARRRGVAEDGCTVAALLSAGERLPAARRTTTRAPTSWSSWSRTGSRAPPRPSARFAGWSIRRGSPEGRRCAARSPCSPPFPTAWRAAVRAPNCSWPPAGPPRSPQQHVVTGAFLIAVEAEDRRDQKAPLVRIASAIEPEWLIDLFPDRVRETSQVEWNRAAERVEAVSALWFDQIAIQETPRHAPDPEAAAALLAAKALEAGLARFTDVEEVEAFPERDRFAAQHGPSPLTLPAVKRRWRRSPTA